MMIGLGDTGLWFCKLPNGNGIVVRSSTDPTGRIQTDPAGQDVGYGAGKNYVASARPYNPNNDVNNNGFIEDAGPLAPGVPSATPTYQGGLTQDQVNYLMVQGTILPVTNMSQPIVLNPNAVTPVAVNQSSPAAVQTYLQSQLPYNYQTYNVATPMPTAPTGPQTVSLGIPPVQTAPATSGTIPGASTAAASAGNTPAPLAPVNSNGTATATPAATTGDLIPGMPNTYLYLGGAALLAVLLLKK